MLGLPPDANIELSLTSFHRLVADAETRVRNTVPIPEQRSAIITALENRLDMRVTAGKVADAQRAVVIASDALRSEISLLGSASTGGKQSLGSAGEGNIKPELSKGAISGLLTVDLAFERTAERNNFRNSLIELDRAIRDAQEKEDDIKLQIMVNLQDLQTATETINTQFKAVQLASERQKSTALFLKAGRASMRDLLDAQESLLSARNALTAAIINYRITELNLQKNMGLLQVTDNGLTHEHPLSTRETAGGKQHE
jgi:outer membrane protein TolC